jgi:hypothetical protein
VTGERVWQLEFGSKETIIDVRSQYTSASLAAEHAQVLPTAFGEEGTLLYKYLDSNMFAVTTKNLDDPSTLTLMLVNGVTGSIIHQSKINNVSPNHAYSTVFTENFFAAAFQRRNINTGLSQQELTVVELFSQ